MLHKDIYERYEKELPSQAKEAVVWFPNEKNSIRIRNRRNREFIFTYFPKTDEWSLEPLDYFLQRKERSLKMK